MENVTKKPKLKLEISEELQSLIPPLIAEEEKRLTASLKEEGCREPIWYYHDDAANKDFVVDGFNRRRICLANKIEYRCRLLPNIHNISEAKVWVLKNQLARRNLTTEQRVQLALILNELYKQDGKANQRKAGKLYGKGKKPAKESMEKVNSLKKAAAQANVSVSTVKRHKKKEKQQKEGNTQKSQVSLTFTFATESRNEIKGIIKDAKLEERTKTDSETVLAIFRAYKSKVLDA